MSALKEYILSTEVNNGGLYAQYLEYFIKNSGYVTDYGGLVIDISRDNLIIYGTALADEPSLDALILSHDVQVLGFIKNKRYAEIDNKTNTLLGEGVLVDGVVFSLSLAAQTNWNILKNQESEFVWPVAISTMDNDQYILQQANLSSFWSTGKDRVKLLLDEGRSLKKLIHDATTIDAVNLVVDTR
jgi:hypothetical protein